MKNFFLKIEYVFYKISNKIGYVISLGIYVYKGQFYFIDVIKKVIILC